MKGHFPMSMRFILAFMALLLPLSAFAEAANPIEFSAQIKSLEHKYGGRIGVAALNTANQHKVAYREDESFALCSTFKFLLAAAILTRVDSGKEALDRSIPYSAKDMQEHAPVALQHLAEGKMSVGDLTEGTMIYSDNTAANLLLESVGGPKELTQYIRSLGDKTTRIDRFEPELSDNIRGDPRDTTTPSAMLHAMHQLLIENALTAASKERLTGWLIRNTTGDAKIRAAMPKSWKVGDKTGSGKNGASNDIAIIWPEGQKPFLVSVYYTGSTLSADEKNAVIAEVGRIVRRTFYPEQGL